MVSFGVAREFAGEPELLAILLDRLSISIVRLSWGGFVPHFQL